MIHQATIEAAASSAERIARALEEAPDPAAVAVGLFERGGGRFEVFAHYAEPPPPNLLRRLITESGGDELALELKIETIAPADWVTLSQGMRGPVQAGRFFLHGSHDRGHAPRRRCVIEIDAGRAFGTAHHASTRGCLLALDALLKARRPRSIVDLGTGTGILAIAAASALKQVVWATDADQIAVATARDNARANGALALVRVLEAQGFAHRSLRRFKANLILANLLERALYQLAPAFARHLAPGGKAILSGLMHPQARGIEGRFCSHGFALERRIILDGWTTLIVVRRSTRPVG
jgi:ribosomal protein L11 methyltransferase